MSDKDKKEKIIITKKMYGENYTGLKKNNGKYLRNLIGGNKLVGNNYTGKSIKKQPPKSAHTPIQKNLNKKESN